MNAWKVPYEAHTSVVGYASEGSACLREAASAKVGPTKHVEEPRASAHGGSTYHCGPEGRANFVHPEIAKPLPSKARNLRVSFGLASQPFYSSQ
jgi:hypothetical protein